MNKIEELEGKIEELSNELEELKKEKENTYDNNWFPKAGEEYWFINCEGNIDSSIWENNNIDIFRRDYIKIFKTREEAEEYYDYIQAKKKYSHEFTQEEWEDDRIDKPSIYYDFECNHLKVSVGIGLIVKCIGKIHFKTHKDAEEFINKYEKQIKKYDIGIKEV